MSIQSEINRISGNVSDALDAIEEKGVTIPSGANSDDLANLIGQISSGSEIPDGNNMSFGYTDVTLPYVGIAKVGQAVI